MRVLSVSLNVCLVVLQLQGSTELLEVQSRAQQILPAHKTIYFQWLLKTNLLPEIIVSQAQLAFICSNSATITVE